MPQPLRYTEDRPQVQFRLPAQWVDRLQTEAERRGISKTLLVERLVMDALPRMEKQKI